MCTFIGIECLAANALIELYGKDITEISFENLADYGLMVVDEYESETLENATLIFNQEKLWGLVINYSDFFEVKERENGKYICLKENTDMKKLKEQFRWTLSYEMLKVLKKVDIFDAIQVA